jgi:L-threonylcarbamoyladenylate synthase
MARILAPDELGEAARILANGGLVAFPTETVYGLGADATNSAAVARIFAAKGRPTTNPLIVHLDSAASAPKWAAHWPEPARRLAEAFWPGPLALLKLVQRPLAAPSANRSNRLSPTRAEHVAEELGGAVDAIVDGGPCHVGIESTVCEILELGFRILRPGAISPAQIAEIAGLPLLEQDAVRCEDDVLRSPGQFPRHYAPRVPLILVEMSQHQEPPPGVVFLRIGQRETDGYPLLPPSPAGFGQRLYDALRRAEATEGAQAIWLESPPRTPEWDAIWDRLRRASAMED